MKKIKFMLLSLSLVAVVGGALAFKAKALAFKAKFEDTFCTAALPAVGTCGQAGKFCPNKAQLKTTTTEGTLICTTKPDANGNCPATLRCANTSNIIKSDQ